MRVCAIIPAAGQGVRMGKAKPKQFLDIFGKPILIHTAEAVSRAGFLDGMVLVVPAPYLAEARQLAAKHLRPPPSISVVAGGKERQNSVWNALRCVPADCEWVLIHDGARPLVSSALLHSTWKAAQITGAAIAAVPATDTVKRVHNGRVQETLAREAIWLVQTPQVFRVELLRRAYEQLQQQDWLVTDDASLVERLNVPVAVVPGERFNIKITTPEDLVWMEWFMTNNHAGIQTSCPAAGG
jgi:2-C-methyl-D-erythritol 4-phosphate cytidylyltransferase